MTLTSPSGPDRVLQAIKSAILRGELLPGEQLKQEKLAAELGVSRVPLREALLVLANQGLLVHNRHQGFVVAKRSRDELAQLHHLLSMLETELLRTIKWPDEETLAHLRDLNQQMSALVDSDDWLDIVELNHEFHQVLWRQSTLNLISDQVQRMWPLADAYVARGYTLQENRAQAVDYHDRIIEALEAHDENQLQVVSAEHRRSTIEGADPTFT